MYTQFAYLVGPEAGDEDESWEHEHTGIEDPHHGVVVEE